MRGRARPWFRFNASEDRAFVSFWLAADGRLTKGASQGALFVFTVLSLLIIGFALTLPREGADLVAGTLLAGCLLMLGLIADKLLGF